MRVLLSSIFKCLLVRFLENFGGFVCIGCNWLYFVMVDGKNGFVRYGAKNGFEPAFVVRHGVPLYFELYHGEGRRSEIGMGQVMTREGDVNFELEASRR